MSFQGREFTPEMVEFVVRVKGYFDEERRTGTVASTQNPGARTAAALGIGEATVKRIMSRRNKGNADDETGVPTDRGRPEQRVSPNLQPVVRSIVRAANLKGQRVSLGRLRKALAEECEAKIPTATLWRTLARWGFSYGEGRRRCALREQSYVVNARRKYIRIKRENRNADGSLKRPEVYLDETYINKNHSARFTWYQEKDGPWVNKPSGVGPRLIIVNAITADGWVDGAQLVFEAKKRTGDYHGQMDWENFSKWFTTQLMPNIPKNSLIVLDNAGYHNVLAEQAFPRGTHTKQELEKWLNHNGIPIRNDMLKSELYELCRRFAPVPMFKLDQLAAEQGHVILRTPPYHPELQPIETCWAIVKNHMADNCDFTMGNLRAQLPVAFSKVTGTICQEIIQKVVAQEEKYWLEDEELDEVYAQEDAGQVISVAIDEHSEDESFLEDSEG